MSASIETSFTSLMKIRLPIIVAPMFLVSNEHMLVSAAENGAIGVVPSLNYRPSSKFAEALKNIRARTQKPFGVNLIVQKTNPYVKEHLKLSLDAGTPFFITSLGNPKEVITEAHKIGAKVFCDVVGSEHAKKAVDLGADGLIAVSSGAGGHAGPITASILIPLLKKKFKVPVIAAGGVADGAGLASMLALGADGVSVGTRFIASNESPVHEDYKNAILESGAEDIVMTKKISGTPCSVINTPYVQKMGLEQNWFEGMLSKNSKLKKYVKMLIQFRGMKFLEAAAFNSTYKSLWCAGQTVELVNEIKSIQSILEDFAKEYESAVKALPRLSS
ncbi:MAG: nitronate monooxygenase [Deltaproteobacteria bacterium]|nr:nitronate monooxygenase [Deltaproteobacteria bacterium]